MNNELRTRLIRLKSGYIKLVFILPMTMSHPDIKTEVKMITRVSTMDLFLQSAEYNLQSGIADLRSIQQMIYNSDRSLSIETFVGDIVLTPDQAIALLAQLRHQFVNRRIR